MVVVVIGENDTEEEKKLERRRENEQMVRKITSSLNCIDPFCPKLKSLTPHL
jgi:hypothetical protein